jgi:hypothetical protein
MDLHRLGEERSIAYELPGALEDLARNPGTLF